MPIFAVNFFTGAILINLESSQKIMRANIECSRGLYEYDKYYFM